MTLPTPLPEPSPAEQQAIAVASEQVARRRKPPKAKLSIRPEPDGTKTVRIAPMHSDLVGWSAHMMAAHGTVSADFATVEGHRIVNAIIPASGPPSEVELNAVLATVHGIEPQDEVEAMLASQMAVTHALVMDLLGRVRRSGNLSHLEAVGSMATKFQRTFVAQTEALAKLRRGGEQTVRVEHVTVAAGGQAIVGVVQQGPGRGGQRGRSEQTHAAEPGALAAPAIGPLRGEDAAGHAVSGAGGSRQEALPHARRSRGDRRAARIAQRPVQDRPPHTGSDCRPALDASPSSGSAHEPARELSQEEVGHDA
jgi:hypothetical protein